MKKCRLVVLLACFLMSCFSWAAPNKNSNESTFTPAQEQEIQRIIKNYLIKNPEVLLDASKALQQKEEAKAQQEALSAITANIKSLFNNPKSPTAGNPNGSIQIIEFFDYQCGHCKAMAATIEDILKSNPNIKLIFKELPIFGGNSRFAAKAALASTAQGKYFAFHNALFNAESALNPTVIFNIAKSIGLDTDKLKQTMNKPWINRELRNNFLLAQELRLVGTPAFIISNKDHTKFRFIPGATSEDDFKQQIQQVQSAK